MPPFFQILASWMSLQITLKEIYIYIYLFFPNNFHKLKKFFLIGKYTADVSLVKKHTRI